MEREEVQWCTGPSPGMAEWARPGAGCPARLLPAHRPRRREAPIPRKVFASPALRALGAGLVPFPEGCAGLAACGPRCRAAQLSGLNEAGDAVSWQASGWAARILQHEMDHLQGILYIDKMESWTFVNTRWMELSA
ncbi:unnamed protein product [Lepidochelys kempii]